MQPGESQIVAVDDHPQRMAPDVAGGELND
jgi:hypothetical protein